MLIGLIADTHDNLPRVRQAVGIFNKAGVDLVLHAGDWCSPFVLAEFGTLEAPLIGVWGNNDGDRQLLQQRAAGLETVNITGYVAETEADGVKIGMTHGHENAIFSALARSGAYDIMVFGHTHQVEISRMGRTLLINPGEACGYLSGRATAAFLDVDIRKAEIIDLEDEAGR